MSQADGVKLTTASPPRPPRWRRWGVALCAAALSGGLTFGALEYWFARRIPVLLEGKWVVVDGKYQGATLEFFRDGTMTSNLNPATKEGVIRGSARVDGTL